MAGFKSRGFMSRLPFSSRTFTMSAKQSSHSDSCFCVKSLPARAMRLLCFSCAYYTTLWQKKESPF